MSAKTFTLCVMSAMIGKMIKSNEFVFFFGKEWSFTKVIKEIIKTPFCRLFSKRPPHPTCPECRGELTHKKNLFMEKVLAQLTKVPLPFFHLSSKSQRRKTANWMYDKIFFSDWVQMGRVFFCQSQRRSGNETSRRLQSQTGQVSWGKISADYAGNCTADAINFS